jgi:WD40-like Beta Propeller Repeat
MKKIGCFAGRVTFAATIATLLAISLSDLHASSFAKSDWSEPVNLGAAINSPFSEANVFLSRDELTLYFSSNRPGGFGGLDIYVSHRASVYSAWQAPMNIGPPINTESNDLGPNLSVDGHLLFFASDRPGGEGSTDIYVSQRPDPNDDFAWETPANIGPPINTADQELTPFYLQNAEDGSGNLYFSRGLQSAGLQDIYYGSVTREGFAHGEVVFVAELNSSVNDFAMTIRKDGRDIFFASPRPGGRGNVDIWMSNRKSIHHAWETPVNANSSLNSVFSDVTPHLSFDGRTLIFGTNRPGGFGGNDLWMSTRTPSGH